MADYVEVPHASSSVEYVDEALVSRARSGAVKMRRLQTGTKRVFHIALRGLTAARRDALMTLYTSKRATTLTFNWYPSYIGSPSESNIVVLFGPDPIRWTQDGNRWDADHDLLEV